MITRRRMFAVATAAVAVFSTPAAFAVGDPTGDPEQWILAISNDILEAIRHNAGLGAADPVQVRKFVDEKIMPVVDFTRMTRSSVGPKWRTATPEQRQTLQDLFRDQLINVYSGALAQVKDQTVKLAPNRVAPTESSALVRSLLVSPGKPDVHIDYRLTKENGQWRIVDVNVEGMWLVDNYRSQFSSTVNSQGIEGLIKALQSKAHPAS